MDPAAMWRARGPVVADDPDCSPGEAVRVLRGQSLVAVDGALPAGEAGSGVYDTAIAINSVLQEVIRAMVARSSAREIVDLLSWHVQKWMFTASELGLHERTLVMAAHAEAVEAHASRMNLSTDFIEFLRGNLSVTLFRQNRKQEAGRMLRAEIAHFQGRHDEAAELATCQAYIQLAEVLADDGVAEAEEGVNLLEAAYLSLANSTSHSPEGAAFLAADIYSALTHLGRVYEELPRLAELTAKVQDLTRRLPATELSRALRVSIEIAECMHEHRDRPRAITLARQLIDGDLAEAEVPEALNLRRNVRIPLIEALIAEGRPREALKELECFIAETPPQMFAYEIKELVHNSGYQCLLASLAGDRAAARVLSRLLADGRAELIDGAFSSETAARIRLLRGGDAFNQGHLDLAQRLTDESMADRSQREGGSVQRDGWQNAAGRLAGAIAAARDKAAGFARPAQRKGSGMGRLLQLAQGHQNRLESCPVELLPLYATLAAISVQFDAPAGARAVSFCHQIQGCLSHLGFDSEVVAATAKVIPVEGQAEYIGEHLRTPRLQADGTSDGHAVIWARSFGQLLDPAITETWLVRKATERAGISMLAAPLENRDQLLRGPEFHFHLQSGVVIELRLRPHWTRELTPAPGSELDAGLSYAQLALAHTVVELMQGAADIRADLPRIPSQYPLLGDLLDGSALLPELPGEPPTAFLRLHKCFLRR
jgi:tetratricopeptide (TPR) repeat protein